MRFLSLLTALFVCSNPGWAQLPVSANGKIVKVRGVNLYYEESGKGEPVFMLHGFMRTAADWEYAAKEISKTHRVINVDLPNHGRSAPMDSSNVFLHKKAAEYILALADTLKIGRFSVVSFSSGSFVALYMATMKRERIDKLVLVGSQIYFSDSTRKIMRLSAIPRKKMRMI